MAPGSVRRCARLRISLTSHRAEYEAEGNEVSSYGFSHQAYMFHDVRKAVRDAFATNSHLSEVTQVPRVLRGFRALMGGTPAVCVGLCAHINKLFDRRNSRSHWLCLTTTRGSWSLQLSQ